MPFAKRLPRITKLAAVTLIAGYLTLHLLGGFLVFGFTNSFAGFCMFFVPILALLIALAAWWNARISASLWALTMLLFFGAQIILAWPDLRSLATNGMHFLAFLFAEFLLTWTAVSDTITARQQN
jgi:hypothetical protein